ncbi:CotH kinase family protein [Lachnospiraceae bacterium JLR.KK008]
MIAQKYISKIVVVMMAVAVGLCLVAMSYGGAVVETLGGAAVTMEYESMLFDTDEVIRANIIMDEEDWEEMLANPLAEAYYPCDITINGETFYHVGIRPKGNTSLTSVANDPDTDRYSLKLKFDHYVDGQTCYGLDKLILNNNYADATNMKEALIYDMYQYLDADASLYNYAELSVNGEYWGVYLALEAVEESFLMRNYGTENGELYKPDSMKLNGRNDGAGGPPMGDKKRSDPPMGRRNDSSPPREDTNSGGSSSEDRNGSSPRMGGNGANLNYVDDNPGSYSAIWEGEVTATTEADHKRVVKALKNISEGIELETYMDVDNLLKYMAVHVFSVNEDSLSGMMAHNYYLYESEGQLNIIPWDYNLAFGGMGRMDGKDGKDGKQRMSEKNRVSGSDNATATVNDPVDHAFSGTEFFDTLMENEEYHETYYGYLQQLVDEYVLGGGFDDFYNHTRSRLDPLIENDPTVFYTYEEYEAAADVLYEVVRLRGQSVDGQITGAIPSTEREQEISDALIDASHLDLNIMGSMEMGGHGD